MNEFFNALKNKRARKEYIKSIVVGWISTALDFLVTAIILYIAGRKQYTGFMSVFTGNTITGEPYDPILSVYLMSIVVSFIISVSVNYLLSAFFVYEYGNVGRNAKGFVKFMVFSLIGLTITTLGSFIGISLIGNVWVVKILVTLIVFVFNFFTRKYFVFNIALIRDDDTISL